MAISYCTLEQAEYEAEIESTTGDFERYYNVIYPQVTRRIDQLTNNLFAPRIATRYYDVANPLLDTGSLYLNYPIVALSSVSFEGTAQTLSDFELETYNERPAMAVYSDSGFTGFTKTRRAIAITGTWVERSYYSEAWDSVTTLNGAIASTSTTSVTVNDAQYIDIGDMIQIESEWLSVSAKVGNVLTVERGIHGSTAATHSDTTAVSRWIPEPDIQHAAAKIVAYTYSRRGKYEQVQFDVAGGSVAVQLPPDLPRAVINTLNRYAIMTR